MKFSICESGEVPGWYPEMQDLLKLFGNRLAVTVA